MAAAGSTAPATVGSTACVSEDMTLNNTKVVCGKDSCKESEINQRLDSDCEKEGRAHYLYAPARRGRYVAVVARSADRLPLSRRRHRVIV